ncbi:hypothetical protein [Methanosarcina horonobensis]|nr:hypothetical protein [Methanosarcina horonobensis]
MSDTKAPKKTTPKLPDKEPIKTVNLQANRKVTKKSTGNVKR